MSEYQTVWRGSYGDLDSAVDRLDDLFHSGDKGQLVIEFTWLPDFVGAWLKGRLESELDGQGVKRVGPVTTGDNTLTIGFEKRSPALALIWPIVVWLLQVAAVIFAAWIGWQLITNVSITRQARKLLGSPYLWIAAGGGLVLLYLLSD